MEESNTCNKYINFISEGILILLITAMFYLIVFNYYIGYCSFYLGIDVNNIISQGFKIGYYDNYLYPSIFSNLSLYNLIAISFKFSLIILSCFTFLFLALFINKDSTILLKVSKIKFTVISCLIIVAIGSKIGFNQHLLTLFLITFILILLFEIILPLTAGKKEKGFFDRLAKGQNELYVPNNYLKYLFKRQNVLFIIYIVAGIFIPTSLHVGYLDAERKIDYFVINNNGISYAVIDSNEGNYFVIPFDIKTKKSQTKFQIISIDSVAQNNIEVQYESIGPLKIIK